MKSWRNRLMLRGLKLSGLIRRRNMYPILSTPCLLEVRLPRVLPSMMSHYLIGRCTTGILLNNRYTLTQLSFLASLLLILLLSYTLKTLILDVSSRVFIQPWFISKTFTMESKYFTINICKRMNAMYDMHDPNTGAHDPNTGSFYVVKLCSQLGVWEQCASSTTSKFEPWILQSWYICC